MSLTIPTGVFGFISYTQSPEDLPQIDYGQLWYEEVPVPTLIVASMVSTGYTNLIQTFQKTSSFPAAMILAFVSSLVCYASAIILSYKTFGLTSHSSYLSERSKSMQRQLNRVLITQVCTEFDTHLASILLGLLPLDNIGSSGVVRDDIQRSASFRTKPFFSINDVRLYMVI